MTRRWMLLSKSNHVVAEVTDSAAKHALDSGKYSLLKWRDKSYIYDERLRHGEYEYFCEIGQTLRLIKGDVTERKSS